MKYLFYNPCEVPVKIRIKSTCSNIDLEYEPFDAGDKPVYLDELIKMAKSECFDDVQVYLSSHNEAYTKENKKDFVGTRVKGWISLKTVKNGGGYLDDFCLKLNDPE